MVLNRSFMGLFAVAASVGILPSCPVSAQVESLPTLAAANSAYAPLPVTSGQQWDVPAETGIPIAVPPPESVNLNHVLQLRSSGRSPQATVPVVEVQPTSVAQTIPALILPPNLNVLPVPDGNIPVGNVEGMPTIAIPRDATQNRGTTSPGVNRAAALGLNYRVVVGAPDEASQQLVKSVVPDAFRTWINGQSVMQVGAYADMENAQEMVQILGQYGMQAIVQQIQ